MLRDSTNLLIDADVPPPPVDPDRRRWLLVANLDPRTKTDTILSVMSQFGAVDRVQLLLERNERSGQALVSFRQTPDDTRFVDRKDIRIDGIRVVMQFASPELVEQMTAGQQKFSFHAAELYLGVMLSETEFVPRWKNILSVSFELNLTARRIRVYFNHLGDRYRLELDTADLVDSINLTRKHARKGAAAQILFTSRCAPKVWKTKRGPTDQTMVKTSRGNLQRRFDRIINVPVNESAAIVANKPKARSPVFPFAAEYLIDFNKWLSFSMTFLLSQESMTQFNVMVQTAAEYNLMLERPPVAFRPPPQSRTFYNHVERARCVEDFDILYLLEAAISTNTFNEINLDDDFMDIMKRILRLDARPYSNALIHLIKKNEHFWRPNDAVKEVLNTDSNWSKEPTVSSHCVLMRKAYISPTGISFTVPTAEVTNRVIRQFKDHADRFLRVQFVDEGRTRLGASFDDSIQSSNSALCDRVFEVLKNGIQIGRRRYEFLAFSSSQLRDHGCWFFAPTRDLNPSMIRQWMGTFDHVKNIAKNAIRMGQCFSSTTPVTMLQSNEVTIIDDITQGPYCFTDGVGKISFSLARDISQQLKLDHTPSAYQIRLGGAKGVLMVSSFLSKRQVQLRPSQIKFESSHTMLEVVRPAVFLSATLNRQSIILLSARGIRDSVFIDKTREIMRTLDRGLEDASAAVRMLSDNVDPYGISQSMARMIRAGFLNRKDPHLMNLMNVFRVSKLKDLKQKTKIDVSQGAFLMGVVDDTSSLEENEIFVQVSQAVNFGTNKETQKRTVITGECVIFRNPCFHPGDVRVVQAVDCPKLRHMHDVVVFSAAGRRDLPSMLSGGDLDGDDYTVIWDPSLIPVGPNPPPLSYMSGRSHEVKGNVTISDIISFFVRYINNDNLGQIANAHLGTADQSPEGAADGRCLHLAQLHSEAVDYPKTGVPARLTEGLRVSRFPDFMEKRDKESYESRTVLGRIYRMIDKGEYENYDRALTWTRRFDDRLWTQGMEQYLDEARQVRDRYNRDLTALMNQYGLKTEAEAISGCVVESTKRSNVHRSAHELQQQLREAIRRLGREYLDIFDREFRNRGGRDSAEIERQKQAKAAAWYYVTYSDDELRKNESPDAHLLSFPWVAGRHLCNLARANHHRDPATIASHMPQVCLQGRSMNTTGVPSLVGSAREEEQEEEEDEDEEEEDEYDDDDEEDEEDTNVITLDELRGHKPGMAAGSVRANATEDELAATLLGKNA
ncbi:RNA dependent RNA polymerase-domain-containing protein [Syncephalastrum racemosum]|uniref:RNA-dependent RNA polymerase n=1 Tax=Syncephalastrum racemosum TaxID=13706 RepID=A0A1X2HEN0_SYNRA|nr:RNA dependent RNA polymerase-domain-containing protein [Syncephalastrum racemosum]